jgi:hypothetical protein
VDARDEIVADWLYLGPHPDDYRPVGRPEHSPTTAPQFQAAVNRSVVLTIPPVDRAQGTARPLAD